MSLVQKLINALPIRMASVFSPIAGVDAAGNSQLVGVSDGAVKVVVAGISAFQSTVTSVGNGADASLEKQATAGLFSRTLVTIYNEATDELQDWLLVASTAATGPDIQRPNDYNALTNAKVWFRKR